MRDYEHIVIIAMICVTATICVSFLAKCEHKNITVTCNTNEKSCLDYLYRVTR